MYDTLVVIFSNLNISNGEYDAARDGFLIVLFPLQKPIRRILIWSFQNSG